MVAGIGLNLANSVLGGAAPQSSLNTMNTVQLILLLPLVGAYMPVNVITFITGMNFSLLNFDFISLQENPLSQKEISEISFYQKDPYLNLIGFESGS
jgi:hypothetical protein